MMTILPLTVYCEVKSNWSRNLHERERERILEIESLQSPFVLLFDYLLNSPFTYGSYVIESLVSRTI